MEINIDQILASIKESIAAFLGYGFGSTEFYVVAAVALASIIFFGKLLASWVAGSSRGFIAVTIALLLPVAVYLLTRATLEIYLPTVIENPDWAHYSITFLSYFSAGLAVAFITPFFIDASILKSIFTFGLTFVLMVVAINLSGSLVGTFIAGAKNVKKNTSYAVPGAAQILEGTPLEKWVSPEKDTTKPSPKSIYKRSTKPQAQPSSRY